MLAILVKLLAIFRHAFVNIFFRTGTLISINISNPLMCRLSCSEDSFTILDTAATNSQIRLKEAMFICWEKPVFSQQLHYVKSVSLLLAFFLVTLLVFVICCTLNRISFNYI